MTLIDLHCHILPGIDDGPPTMGAALELARAHVAAGTSCVAATSHVAAAFPNDAPAMERLAEVLEARLEEEGLPLRLVRGAEVELAWASALSDDALSALTLGDGPWLLVEAPLSNAAVGVDPLIRHLQLRGHQVLLAHPERAPVFQRDPGQLTALVDGGVLTQVTAGALVGRFGSTVRRFALDLVARGLVHTVASDAHDLHRRPPGMLAELERAGLAEQLHVWCEAAPAAILDGTPVPHAEPPPARRRCFGLRRSQPGS